MASLPTQEELTHLLVGQTVARTLVAPFDRVKYLLQCQGELLRLGRTDRPFLGAYECFRRLATIEGASSFFRGNVTHIASILPTAFAQAFIGMPVQRAVFETLSPQTAAAYTAATFASGIAGALASSVVSYPFDMVRFRLACDVKAFDTAPYLYRSAREFVMHSNIVENPQLMYRGLGLYLCGSVFYRASYLWMFDLVTRFVTPADINDANVPLAVVAQQTIAGYGILAAATMWMYPLDTVRRRLMLSVNHYGLEYQSVMHCVQAIVREEGLAALYRGASFALVRGAVTTCIAVCIGINI